MYSSQQFNARIKNVAQDLGVSDVNRIRGIVTLERVIARLMTNSFLKDHLVFGGGLVLFKELGTDRYTRDADAIISGIGVNELIHEVETALSYDLHDGMWFGDVTTEELSTESGYGGIRFKILYKIGDPAPFEEEKKKLRRIHLDVSIGVDLEDVATTKVTKSIIPSLHAIEWKIYPPEFIASEKIHCILDRGDLNTRGKDIYDLPYIFDEVSNDALLNAIKRTFSLRKFELSSLYEIAGAIDTEYIKKNYELILTEKKQFSFDESWNLILEKFKELDSLNF
jgi:hypothetical protein